MFVKISGDAWLLKCMNNRLLTLLKVMPINVTLRATMAKIRMKEMAPVYDFSIIAKTQWRDVGLQNQIFK